MTRLDPSGLDSMNCWRPSDNSLDYRAVGISFQCEVDAGNYTAGVEVVVYFDPVVCESNDGNPIVELYQFDGMSLDLLDVVNKPQNALLLQETLTLATGLANVSQNNLGTVSSVTALKAINGDANLSGTVSIVLGNNSFQSPGDYLAGFESFSGSIGRKKVSIAYSPTCVALGFGVAYKSNVSLTYSKTYYRYMFDR